MRDIKQLHPKLQEKITQLQAECKKQGLGIRVTDCLRTTAEQDALYAQGRTKPGKIVTKAKGKDYNSMHQWGVAFDFCRNESGKSAYADDDGFFSKVGKIGKSLGLEWGGDWKSIKDKPHFQLSDWGSTPSKLKSQYGTPEKFFKTWTTTATKTETTTVSNASPKITVEEAAKNVVAGKYGNGDARKKAITDLGLNYDEVQAKVKELLSASAAKTKNKSTTYIVTSKTGLRIRQSASDKAKILGVMPSKSEFVSNGTTANSWIYGTWNGITGWAFGKYLTKK